MCLTVTQCDGQCNGLVKFKTVTETTTIPPTAISFPQTRVFNVSCSGLAAVCGFLFYQLLTPDTRASWPSATGFTHQLSTFILFTN